MRFHDDQLPYLKPLFHRLVTEHIDADAPSAYKKRIHKGFGLPYSKRTRMYVTNSLEGKYSRSPRPYPGFGNPKLSGNRSILHHHSHEAELRRFDAFFLWRNRQNPN
jgi:hypothetical protein